MHGKNAVSSSDEIKTPTGRRSLAPINLGILNRLRAQYHWQCLACSQPMFRLEFEHDTSGLEEYLVARFKPTTEHCSYQGVIHGGLVSLLTDEAMTCCLLAHGIVGVTAELKLRYLETVEVEEFELRTRVTKAFAPLYHLETQLIQGGVVRVRGNAKFLQKPIESK